MVVGDPGRGDLREDAGGLDAVVHRGQAGAKQHVKDGEAAALRMMGKSK